MGGDSELRVEAAGKFKNTATPSSLTRESGLSEAKKTAKVPIVLFDDS